MGAFGGREYELSVLGGRGGDELYFRKHQPVTNSPMKGRSVDIMLRCQSLERNVCSQAVSSPKMAQET